MNNEIIEEKSWLKRNWKWFVSLVGFFLISMSLFFSSDLSGHVSDFAKAYADSELSEKALEVAKKNESVIDLLGDLEPISNFAILDGDVLYSNNNNSVNLTFRVTGNKGYGAMDISADKKNSKWEYKKINIRIKEPIEKKQTIEIIKQTK